jgi:uncharacterized protein (TIGR03435 family)
MLRHAKRRTLMESFGMKPLLVCVSLVFLAASVAYSQPVPAGQPAAQQALAFDVASVKVSQIGKAGGEGSRRENVEQSPGSLSMRNVSLTSAIKYAYRVMDYQVSGPAWLGSERYDIVAKASGPAPESELRAMLQSLLAERFKLAFHRETKEMPVYVLLEAKGGNKLHESASEGPPSFKGGKLAMTAKNATLAGLCDLVSGPLQRPVVDMTGLKKQYDFTLDVTGAINPEAPTGMDEVITILMKLVQEQLGLKLEPRKAPVELLIIDRAEKTPTEN